MESPILVTATLLLLPLFPSAAIYWLLTPKSVRNNAENQQAAGEFKASGIEGISGGFKFSVLGSAATYIVLLGAGMYIHSSAYDQQVQRQESAFAQQSERDQLLQAALSDGSVWRVEIPITLEDEEDLNISGSGIEGSFTVEALPGYKITDNTLLFWAIPDEYQKFPSVNVTLTKTSGETLNLNDPVKFAHYPAERRIEYLGEFYLQRGKQYNAAAATAPTAP